MDLGPFIPIAIGVLFLFLGIAGYASGSKMKANCTGHTQAKLIGYEEEIVNTADSPTYKTYAPVFQFMAGGQEHTVKHAVGRRRRQWGVGEYVPISYDPLKPSSFLIDGDNGGYAAFTVMTVFGLAGIALGIHLLGIW